MTPILDSDVSLCRISVDCNGFAGSLGVSRLQNLVGSPIGMVDQCRYIMNSKFAPPENIPI